MAKFGGFTVHVMGQVGNTPYDIRGNTIVPGTVFDTDDPAAAALDYIIKNMRIFSLNNSNATSGRDYIRVGCSVIDPTTIMFLHIVDSGTPIESQEEW